MSRLRQLEAQLDNPHWRPSTNQALEDLRYIFTLLRRHRAVQASRRKRATRTREP